MGFFSANFLPAEVLSPSALQRTIQPMKLMENVFRRTLPIVLAVTLATLFGSIPAARVLAQSTAVIPTAPQHPASERAAGGEANLIIPDLSQVQFLGMNGRSLLLGGLVVCAL